MKKKLTTAEIHRAARHAETMVADALLSLKRKGVLEFERIPDSKTAGVGNGGRYLPGRRSDFDAMCRGRYALIEVKNSLVRSNFKGMNIAKTFRPSQLSAAHRWKAQGAVTIALFHGVDGWLHLPTWLIAEWQIKGLKSIPEEGFSIPKWGLSETIERILTDT